MTKKLTPVQRFILKDLYDNILSFAKKHLNPKNQIVYRIYERSNKPIRNVNPKIFEHLMKEGYIKRTHENLYIITFKANQLFVKN